MPKHVGNQTGKFVTVGWAISGSSSNFVTFILVVVSYNMYLARLLRAPSATAPGDNCPPAAFPYM